MIVVSDTSPLTALLTLGKADLLAQLFAEVFIPQAVQMELSRSHAGLPEWLQVRVVRDKQQVQRFSELVDSGEAEAIVLAGELHADRVLMDERKGRRLATQQGLRVVGLLGVVLLARQRGLIPSARALLERLDREAGMYLADDVREAALKSVGE